MLLLVVYSGIFSGKPQFSLLIPTIKYLMIICVGHVTVLCILHVTEVFTLYVFTYLGTTDN